jgi:ribosomal protein S18 acetylase RimI-like enzyme
MHIEDHRLILAGRPLERLVASRPGLGKALLQLAETEARRAGFDSLRLYTHEQMTENLSLYSRIGYVEYDRRQQRGLSRVYLRKDL